MRFFLLLCFLVFALYAHNNISKTDPFKNIRYFKLHNGLQVYLLADPKAEKTSIRAIVNVGFNNETDKNYGISHLVEHLIFRDQRIPHHDYLDYLEDEGAIDVNGYTRRYETEFTATIPAAKSYRTIQLFSQMLFDKNITKEDLDIERKALQTEIGEAHWYGLPLYALAYFFISAMPPQEDFFSEEFRLPKDKQLPTRFYAQYNNKYFTMDQVITRYKEYYYPANMKLFVTGNFNPDKMRITIEKYFGMITRTGTKKILKPHYEPKLNNRPYKRFYEGTPKNYAQIGAKYVLDDYKKYLILDVYTEALAQRLQRLLRNQNGKTYTVYENGFADKSAGVALIQFDGLRDNLLYNIQIAEKMIEADRIKMNPTLIETALKQYENRYYANIEHDVYSLMELVDLADYLRMEHNISDRTSYSIFKSITTQSFQSTITEIFQPQNSYKIVGLQYYFFPMDTLLLSLVGLMLFILFYIFFARWQQRRKGITYSHRDIIFQRRLSSPFTSFVVFLLTALIAIISYEWIKYLLLKLLFDDPEWMMTITPPYSYLITLLDSMGYFIWFFVLYYYLWHYSARLTVLKSKIVLFGNKTMAIEKNNIEKLNIVTPKDREKGVKTYGFSWRFWKPLVTLVCKNGKRCYLRTSNAQHLKEDLEKWLNSKE